VTDEAENKLQAIRLPDDFVERGYREAFGETREEAQDKRVCVSCKQHPTFTTEAGRREYEISGLCEPCWDRITMPPDEPEDG
jgi:hypothetical protein